jgi:hypothetical protein
MEINKKRLVKELLEKDDLLEYDMEIIFQAIEKIDSFKRKKSIKIKLSDNNIMEISKKTGGFYPAYFFKWRDKTHYHAINPYQDIL